MRSLPSSEKIKAVREILEKGRPFSEVSRKYGCSRQSLYLWIRLYKKLQSSQSVSRTDGFSLDKIFGPKYRKGRSHPRSFRGNLEKQILDVATGDPTLSIRRIVEELKARKIQVSVHGVYNVLVRKGLLSEETRKRAALLQPSSYKATLIPPEKRALAVSEFLNEGKQISAICKSFGISRPTFYEWVRRYKEVSAFPTPGESEPTPGVTGNVVEALTRRYKKGEEHHRSVPAKVKDVVLDLVSQNPGLSAHKIYDQVKSLGLAVVGHHGIQNILSREGLSTFAKRLLFTGSVAPGQKVEVAPLYHPVMPSYKWKEILFAPFKTLPKLLISNPKSGAGRLFVLSIPMVFLIIWVRMVVSPERGISPIGLVFASVALFFGLFFFVYSMKYYISILMVLRLAQGGSGSQLSGGAKP